MEAALIYADEKTKVMGTLRKTYANEPYNIFSACTVVFFPNGVPSYPSNSASCVFPPAMLYFRCVCILCLKSETEKGNDNYIYASPLSVSVSETRRVTEGRTGVCTDGCFASPEPRVPATQKKHSVQTAPCCRGSQLN
jgi:hypothetical protein